MNTEILLSVVALGVMVAIGIWARQCMKPEPVTKVAAEQLREARILALKHRAAAEEHKAMADMFDERARRLQPPEVELVPAGFTFQDTQFGGL